MYTEHELALGRVLYESADNDVRVWGPWDRLDQPARNMYVASAISVAKHVLQSPTVWKIRLGVRTPTPAEQVAGAADKLREAVADPQVPHPAWTSRILRDDSATSAPSFKDWSGAGDAPTYYGHSLEERLYTARRLEEQAREARG